MIYTKNNQTSNFNSHAHVERDPCATSQSCVEKYFNSHAHVERDGMEDTADEPVDDFNSHAHVERDT